MEQEMSEKDIIKYLEKFGQVEILKPIKNSQGKKIARATYLVSLFMNSDVEDKKFIDFCAKHQAICQFDLFN